MNPVSFDRRPFRDTFSENGNEEYPSVSADSSIRILFIGDGSADMLSIRRAMKKCDFHFELVVVEAPLAKSHVAAGYDGVVVDFQAPAGGGEMDGLVDGLWQQGVPVFCVFAADNVAGAADRIRRGVTGYVMAQPGGGHFELLCALMSRALLDSVIGDPASADVPVPASVEKHALMQASLTLLTCHLPDTRVIWSNAGDDDEGDCLVDRYCRDIWQDGGSADGRCPVATCVQTGEPVEAEVTTLDGFPMLQRAVPVRDREGRIRAVVASTLDMSSAAPAREAMRTAERIQSSAAFAGGIAHKFNNLMSGVLGNVSLAQQELPLDHPARAMLGEIEQAALQAGGLSDRLLEFARGDKHQSGLLNMNDVIRETMDTRVYAVVDEIDVGTELADDLWPVDANHAQMSLLLTQVLSNAFESFDDAEGALRAGRIAIRTANQEISRHAESSVPWLKDGRYVLIEVTDTGCGMNDETRRMAFEPFFTTKKKGRGLGLTSAFGIIHGHDGHIMLDSARGRGTTVRIHLPASNVTRLTDAPPPPIAVSGVEDTAPLPGGTETILLVDDETVLRKAIRRLLERLGYRVIEARTGDEALNLAKGHDGPIHVTLLDMIMPGLDGIGTFRQLQKRYPDMPVIIMSGYDRETYEEALLDCGVRSFLQKPVPLNLFAMEIRRVIDDRA